MAMTRFILEPSAPLRSASFYSAIGERAIPWGGGPHIRAQSVRWRFAEAQEASRWYA
jgi:hypothetical protein